MVCLNCFIAPLVLFIWYKFIYPYVQPLIDRFIGNYRLPQPYANLSCPLPKKSVKQETETSEQSADLDSPGGDCAASVVEDKKSL